MQSTFKLLSGSALISAFICTASTAKTPIHGDYLDRSQNVSSVCMISMDRGSSCSGTLIRPDIIVTAAHCLAKKEGSISRIGCGYNEGYTYQVSEDLARVSTAVVFGRPVTSYKVKVRTQEPPAGEATKFTKEFQAERYYAKKAKYTTNTASDYAFIKLKEKAPETIARMKSAASLEDIRSSFFKKTEGGDIYELKDGVECRLAGYGVDDEQKMGALHTVRIAGRIYWGDISSLAKKFPGDIDVTLYRTSEEKSQMIMISSMNPANYFDNGDSGGPLYCYTNNEWVLIGVASSATSITSVERSFTNGEPDKNAKIKETVVHMSFAPVGTDEFNKELESFSGE